MVHRSTCMCGFLLQYMYFSTRLKTNFFQGPFFHHDTRFKNSPRSLKAQVKERNAVLRCSHPTPPRRRASQFRKTRRWAVSLRFQFLRRLINPPQSKRKIPRSETMQANTNPFFAASCGPPSNNKPKEIGPPCTTS